MKTLLAVCTLLLLALGTVCHAEDPSDPADVAELLKTGDMVSLHEGPGGFMLRVLRESEIGVEGPSFTVHRVGRNVVTLRYEPKGDLTGRRYERQLARSSIISVSRSLKANE